MNQMEKAPVAMMSKTDSVATQQNTVCVRAVLIMGVFIGSGIDQEVNKSGDMTVNVVSVIFYLMVLPVSVILMGKHPVAMAIPMGHVEMIQIIVILSTALTIGW